jgi:hypothetical protein
MKKNMPVTPRQFAWLRRRAVALGVTYGDFKKAKADGRLLAFLKSLKRGAVKVISAPAGARIHRINVTVDGSLSWEGVVSQAEKTPPDNPVWVVGGSYEPEKSGVRKIVLLNYPNGRGGLGKAKAWAQGVGLEYAGPRGIFPIGIHCPNLCDVLGVGKMFIVETTKCKDGALDKVCCLWSDRSSWMAALPLVSSLMSNPAVWYAFYERE